MTRLTRSARDEMDLEKRGASDFEASGRPGSARDNPRDHPRDNPRDNPRDGPSAERDFEDAASRIAQKLHGLAKGLRDEPAAPPPLDVPLDVQVPSAPIPFRAGGQQHLIYELHLTNMSRRAVSLMRIDAVDLQLAASAARDQVRSAEAQAAQAIAEEARQRRLLDAGAVSRSAYDAALAAAQSAQAAVDAARSGARQADNQASYGALVADADGVVTEVLAQPGQVVAAGTVVVRLARAGNREAAVAVPETQIATLPRSGQALPFGDTTPIPALLREVAGVADPMTRTFDARFVLSRSDLPLGSTVTIELPRATTTEVLVPLAALHDRGAGPGVWAVQKDQVRFKPVRVIRLGEEAAAIAAGSLANGERIVTLGANQLREGERIRLAATTAAVRP
jgi:RND family efflux transporter MFP subunit